MAITGQNGSLVGHSLGLGHGFMGLGVFMVTWTIDMISGTDIMDPIQKEKPTPLTPALNSTAVRGMILAGMKVLANADSCF